MSRRRSLSNLYVTTLARNAAPKKRLELNSGLAMLPEEQPGILWVPFRKSADLGQI